VARNWFASLLDPNRYSQMVYKDKDTGELEEVVLTMQGYLMKKDLLPLAVKPSQVHLQSTP